MEAFHAALQIARALCTVPPRIAAPEHAVLDFSTVGRSAHGVIRAQLAALLRDAQWLVVATPWRWRESGGGHRAKARKQHVESADATKLGMVILSHSQACLLPCAMLPSSEPHDKANVRAHSLCYHDTSTAPLLRAHTISHAL